MCFPSPTSLRSTTPVWRSRLENGGAAPTPRLTASLSRTSGASVGRPATLTPPHLPHLSLPQVSRGSGVTRKYISLLSGIVQSVSRDGKDVTDAPFLIVSSATQVVSPSSTFPPDTTVLIQTSDTTSTTPSTSTTTTPAPLKATPEFLQTLPPTHSVVFIHPELHDPVRVS